MNEIAEAIIRLVRAYSGRSPDAPNLPIEVDEEDRREAEDDLRRAFEEHRA